VSSPGRRLVLTTLAHGGRIGVDSAHRHLRFRRGCAAIPAAVHPRPIPSPERLLNGRSEPPGCQTESWSLFAGEKWLDGQSGAEDLQPGCSPHPGENRFGPPPVGQMDQRRVCDFRPHPAQLAGPRASGRPSARALPSSCHGMLKNGTHSAERAPREMSSAAVVDICAPVIRGATTISWAHSLPIPRPRPYWRGVLGVCSRPGGSALRPGF